jgi:hypothetical protein
MSVVAETPGNESPNACVVITLSPLVTRTMTAFRWLAAISSRTISAMTSARLPLVADVGSAATAGAARLPAASTAPAAAAAPTSAAARGRRRTRWLLG